jgi:predicted MPP superfamily phosphohydrolase
MTHRPDLIYDLDPRSPPDLVVAGHTHGGQVSVPLVGPLVNFQRLPLRYSSGLHTVEGQRLYVSRGVGMERFEAPRVRFLCPPEITLITLRPSPLDREAR